VVRRWWSRSAEEEAEEAEEEDEEEEEEGEDGLGQNLRIEAI